MAGHVHKVEAGECLSSIAHHYGFTWQKLWELADNAALKRKRKNPNVLFVGDEVHIPEKGKKTESRPTEQRHRFRRKGVPSKFRVRLLEMGRPRANLDYVCEIDDLELKGKTDSDGVIALKIPPGAKKGIIKVTEGDVTEEFEAFFGELDPIDEITGIQQRLANLGHDCEVTGELDDQTKMAMACYRAEKDLKDSEEIDQPLRDALLKDHGA